MISIESMHLSVLICLLLTRVAYGENGRILKNRIILSDGRHLFNPLQIPELNVLGYKALGLVDIDFLSEQESGGYPILFKLRL